MQRDSMVFYRSYYEAGRFLDDKERLDYYDRILNYGVEGVEKKKSEKVEMLFHLIKPNIDSNNNKYISGKGGGRPPKKPVVTKKNNQRFPKKESNVDVEVDKEVELDKDIEIYKEDNAIALEQAPVYGNSDINNILEKIKMYNNGIVDGTQKEQRQYGKMLLDKINKIESVENGKYSPADLLEIILSIISKNDYHSHKIVGPKKIYYELAGLMQICKQEIQKEDKSKIPFIPGI